MPNVTVKHSANIGDLIASLAGLCNKWQDDNSFRFHYMQQLNVKATYMANAVHPTQKDGEMVMCNENMFKMIEPLIKAQPYISDFTAYEGESILVDLDRIRNDGFTGEPMASIQSWYAYVYPDLAPDLSKEWVWVEENHNLPKDIEGKVLVNFTSRYRNQFINYQFLRKYQDNLLFTGTIDEALTFMNMWNLDMKILQIDNFLELAQVMQKSKFLLGNQSFCWNLATALGVPRVLEQFQLAPNCIPFIGKQSLGFYNQRQCEYYFEKLFNETI